MKVDSSCVAQMISKQAAVPNAFYILVVAIQELLSKNWQVSITRIYRETNSAADIFRVTQPCLVPV